MPEPALELVLTDAPTAADADIISAGLNAFNDATVGFADRHPVAVVLRDRASGAVLGGALGRSSLGLLFIDLFYLPDALRGQGWGTQILRMAEDEGRRRGCVAGVLYTISFQGPGFYERNGWVRFGEVACLPPGTSRLFYRKTL